MVGSAARNPAKKPYVWFFRERTMSHMPRCVNHNPRYYKHKASGQAVVTIAGRDFYLGPWKSKASLLEYDRILAEYITSGRRVAPSMGQELSVADLIERYWDYAKQYYGGGNESKLYRIKAALRPLNRLYGLIAACQFGPLALEAVRTTMIESDWCRSTINSRIGRIKAVFNGAYQGKWCRLRYITDCKR
jgi:hypothetical protein